MRKLLHIVAFVILAPFFTWAQGFTTDNTNGNLIDANGNNFIMKGMSVPLQFFQGAVNGSIADVRKNTNANCLRIVMYTYTPDAVWQQCVQNCINNNIIPIVELQEVTGSTDKAELVRMGKYWASKAAYLTQPNIAKYVLINLCNEWGTWNEANSKGTDWRDASTDAIKLMRDAGIKTTIIVDAVGYGQDIDDAKNIRAYAKTMQASDASFLKANANLMFSIHMYCEWKKGGDNVGVIGDIKKTGVPIMIGEFGFQHSEPGGTCDIDESLIINTCEANKIGWLAWSQKGNGNGVEYLDLCSDWSCATLSDWGKTVVNGTYGTKTSMTCSVFLGLTAKAGDDQLVMDVDKNGTESVTLDGSNSSTNKGTLTYAWKENGQTVATVAKPVLNLSVGVHTFTLTVSDGVNTPVSDKVVVTVKTPSLSYLKPVKVTSVEANSLHVGEDAVDGKPDTRWASAPSDPQTITVDLQATYKVSSVVLAWEAASAKDYTVSVSLDGITFNTIITKTGMAAGERTDTWANLDTLARFVRINGTARTSTYGYSLYEFEVWGSNSIAPTKITLNKTATTINNGATEQLIATILPNEATNKTVLWSSSNTDIATVSSTGLVTAKSLGNAIITAKTEDGNLTATCDVSIIGKYIITASAAAHGTITPAGTSLVAPGGSQSFTIAPDADYAIVEILVDGKATTTNPYTFTNVVANHTISATFKSLLNADPIARFTYTSTGSTPAAVQIDVKSLLNARPVITYTNGKIVGTMGGIDAGNYSFEATTAAAIALNNANPVAMSNDGKYAANARHPEVVLNFSNADGTGMQVRRTTVNESFNFAVPEAKYSKMQIFAMSSGMSPITVTLNYTDASTDVRNLQVIDWYNYPGAPAETADRFNLALNTDKWDQTNGRSEQYNHYLYGFDLSPNNNKTLKSVKIDVISGGCFTFWGATGVTNSLAPITVSFDASTSTDADNDPLSYAWDFGDGSTGTGVTTTHIYTKGGIYTATLTVSDGKGGISKSSKTVTILPLPQFAITATAGAGGAISPSGAVSASQASSQTFTITPAKNYTIENVLVDGVSVGRVSTYTFDSVTKAHSISATFAAGVNANIALGKPVVSSSTEPGFGNIDTKVNDGDRLTRWSSDYTDPQWIYVDLLDVYTVSKTIVHWEAACGKDYQIEYSTDAAKWDVIKPYVGMPAGARKDTVDNLSVTARYIRIYGTARTTKYGYSIFELEVYGTKDKPTQTISLQKGWNLISINVSPADSSIATLFKTLDVLVIKDGNTFWRKDQADVFNGLKTITAGNGYLVNMNAAGTLSVIGTPIPFSGFPINQSQNWILIGCPYHTATPISTYFNATNCSVIKNFDGYWKPNGTINSIQNLEPGKGYFIKK